MGRRRLPSLNALRAFEAAGRLGRMSLAGEELAVTHGAVSRQVRHLEQVLAVRLFEGPKNALRLTEAGRVLIPHLTAAFDRIEEGVRAVADEAEGALDVSCLGTLALRWLIPRLHRFRDLQPGVEVRLATSDAPVDFTRGHYEVAIRLADGAPPPGTAATLLFPDEIGPVLAPALAARRQLAHPKHLIGLPRLHTLTRPHAWQAWARRAGFALPDLDGQRFEHFYFMLEAALAGLGVCVAPWPLVADDVRAGRLMAPFGFTPSGQDYVAVRRLRRSRKAQAFCSWLEGEAAGLLPPPPVPTGRCAPPPSVTASADRPACPAPDAEGGEAA